MNNTADNLSTTTDVGMEISKTRAIATANRILNKYDVPLSKLRDVKQLAARDDVSEAQVWEDIYRAVEQLKQLAKEVAK